MIVVHHLAYGRSQRVLWLLEELGVPYEVVAYERMPNHKAPPSLLKVHPLGKAPVVDDTEEGVVLGESAAIITYLLQKYGPKQTTSPEAALDDLYYTHYAESTLVPLIINNQRLSRLTNRAPWYLRPLFRYVFGFYRELYIDPDFPRNCKMVEEHLSKNPWFARGSDRPTAADYAMLRGLGGLVTDKIATAETYPSIVKYVEKIHARPAYQVALRRGDERTK
ncbi:thioredoxin-like protein [Rhodocollybia butyracea]|uniref:Thioredoxin-like protein n=1 Tax=Rhodocollybia butyracea TaxID=206335 RepID=A0A9P5U8Z9_9AGAR|nr:thioredoxin-like protein [Rhodocollybia butyracea]